MIARSLARVFFATAVLGMSPIGHSAPVLQRLAPDPIINYAYGAGADFALAHPTGFGDVTAPLFAVDLMIPSSGFSDSGCEAADFAGFIPGSIALIQRGVCIFGTKAGNAQAAGAVGVLLFNEGNAPGRFDAIEVSLAPLVASVPVFFASFDVGLFLSNGVLDGATGVTVRMKVAPEDLATPVPEPGSIALFAIALAGLGFARRR